ncbi:hypothetical protein TSAR_010823 [Trichomalopsis sarcophagae]|uniref:Uncharacterized protein n=1 Tax=Trichomalopsis sarcophagae TaxID=543379 RepID=A0A232ESW9_9HYME|nr:hypothetical protein TSAR_010823 [Trichomalopsis sarcophagae]
MRKIESAKRRIFPQSYARCLIYKYFPAGWTIFRENSPLRQLLGRVINRGARKNLIKSAHALVLSASRRDAFRIILLRLFTSFPDMPDFSMKIFSLPR